MEELFEQYRALLFTLAYQLTGSTADAEDVVQDVFYKAHEIQPERLKEPKAYLCKMVTNRCLDLQKSARKKREVYVGPWLPEPISTSGEDLVEKIVRRDMLSYAMLVLLERLTPSERAAFILREALGFDYAEIAELLGKRETSCRMLMSRAKSKLGITGEEHITAEAVDLDWVSRFLTSLEQGNVDHVLSLLSEDVILVTDGGGKVVAATSPIQTRDQVALILAGALHALKSQGSLRAEFAPLNGETGIVLRTEGKPAAVIFLQHRHGKFDRIYVVRNPDKLTRV
ncbi:RNA polymerase subunit sigma-24 [Paenibacillus ihbetae]|uniref:RNA polymerase subunit sigma-24 n=1 Tax=Paenibacillus ihbetae TaxID=1870820 RepID=A0A1B2E8H2_9BACL|nr:RNA polymerase sigma factor SigJ [Paenibacillus ihbetae]ANY76264.1 RNA polymerase subunit sigma-24 [Paenibacillus ihbetae]